MEGILRPYINKSINKNDTIIIDKIKSLITNFQFFKNILDNYPNTGELICINILYELIFLEYLPNQIIFKKGDKISSIYIIFSGEINIFDSNIKESENNQQNILEKKNIFPNSSKRKNIFENIYNICNLKIIPNSRLSPGNVLGEEYNYSETNISTNTAQAGKKSILGHIKYYKYNKILNDVRLLEGNQIISFIKSLNLFGNMNNFIDKIKPYIKYKRYPKGSYLFKQGDNYKTFYIIKKGIVNISINLNKIIKSSIQQDLLIGNESRRNFTNERMRELRGYFIDKLNYNLVDFGMGEIVGDIEYYKNYEKYIFTVKCLSSLDIYEVNIKQFKIISDNCGDNIFKFKEKIRLKIEFFEKRIKEINDSLKRKKEDLFTKDKFTSIFIENNFYSEKKERISNKKYINSIFNPIGSYINHRYNSKKMINSSFSNTLNFSNQNIHNNLNSRKENSKSFSSKNIINNKNIIKNSFMKNNKQRFIKSNLKEILLKKSRYLLKNKSISYHGRNLFLKNSNINNLLKTNSFEKKNENNKSREINKMQTRHIHKDNNILERVLSSRNKYINLISSKNKNENNKNENDSRKKFYLINVKNKINYKNGEQINKTYFILNNNTKIRTNSLKHFFFFCNKNDINKIL